MRFYTLFDLADYLGVSNQTAHSWIKKGKLTDPEYVTLKSGRKYRLWSEQEAKDLKKSLK